MKTSKEEILIAAANLFLTKGYDATTTAEVAHAVGLCNSGLFNHFHTKEELYRRVLEVFFLEKHDPTVKFQKSEGNFVDFMDTFIVGVDNTMKELRKIAKSDLCSVDYFIFILSATKKYKDVSDKYLENDNILLDEWKRQIKKAMSSGELKKDLNVDLIADMFHLTYYGRSFIDALSGGLETPRLRETFQAYYEMIKN